ncbi:MAG: hypothetical protein JWM58_3388 [Rhizobium sp.]|nr:hypothetical protein [Rhizobium sp.]
MSEIVSTYPVAAFHTRSNVPTTQRTAMNTLILALGVQIAFLIPSLISHGLDDRLLDGVSVWSKPIKFELSLMIMSATLIWLLPLIAPEARQGRAVRWSALAIALMGTLEITYIVIQAARGRASHFNTSTPLEAYLYNAMGIGAVTIVIGCFVIGWVIWRRANDRAADGLRFGGALGLMLGAVMTLITAGILGSGELAANSHWVGGVRSDAGGLFLVGWSRTGGDLRVPHFFATHIMQGLPLLGLLLDRTLPRFAGRGIWIGAIAGLLVVAGTFIQAMLGRPFL